MSTATKNGNSLCFYGLAWFNAFFYTNTLTIILMYRYETWDGRTTVCRKGVKFDVFLIMDSFYQPKRKITLNGTVGNLCSQK